MQIACFVASINPFMKIMCITHERIKLINIFKTLYTHTYKPPISHYKIIDIKRNSKIIVPIYT